ncbi:sulfite exporter TauE/SafE family protein [Echinicola jeungdonensis]|uniref:Sulfite exporter TauE/SafE family protein n=1 Tax=Echinicola jeungdonensis TaxID=709343 RepID=A0ABV5J0I8_9BACT|nr:sulfite exporter TauE/SafE family protein [Echinicola jeungdonensis]MDN3667784.1 sulfite exporter TauE/SafE family protein [Echinicola jeungdonensis]
MIWTAIVLGFVSSFHCVGMCGPIALAIGSLNKRGYWARKLAYNLGRTMTYSLLGLAIGFLGVGFEMAGMQQGLSIGLGIIMIIFAIFYSKGEKLMAGLGLFQFVGKLKNYLGYWIKRGGAVSFFVTGFLNGLMPCGMVYMALMAALAQGNPLGSSLYMAFFGIGTIPLLLVLMLGGNWINNFGRQKVSQWLPYFGVFIGCLFIFRGLGLGIHFLSPELQLMEIGTTIQEMTMCR